MISDVRASISEILGTRALPLDDVLSAVRERHGVSMAEAHQVADILSSDRSIGWTDELELYDTNNVLEGTRWLVRITPADEADDAVPLLPALAPLVGWLESPYPPLLERDGRIVGALDLDDRWTDDDREVTVVTGPPGWLDGLAGGVAELLVVDGGVRISRAGEPTPPVAELAALVRAGFDEIADQLDPLSTGLIADPDAPHAHAPMARPLFAALLANREAFVAAPPIDIEALYAAAGLKSRGGLVAVEAADWVVVDRARTVVDVAGELDLKYVEAATAILLVALLQPVLDGRTLAEISNDTDGPEGETDGVRLTAAIVQEGLRNEGVAEALWWLMHTRLIPSGGHSAEEVRGALAALFDEVESAVGEPTDGMVWLRARCADWAGDGPGALELLRQLEGDGTDFEVAMIDLAGLLADQGDAAGARRLLARMSVTLPSDDVPRPLTEAEHLLEELTRFGQRRRAAVGRNEPCPCGSGRKYKQCHLGNEVLPFEERARWLWAKAVRFARVRARSLVDELTDAIDEASEGALEDVLYSFPMVVDLALHEGGVFADFLAARSALLPDDEAMLGAQWALTERSAFEVVRRRGSELVLRDLASGETITAVSVDMDDEVGTGSVVFGRPLPVGDTYLVSGGLAAVRRGDVNVLIDAARTNDPLDVATALGRIFAPPRLTNTDGDSLMFHSMRWHLGSVNPDDVDAALRSAGAVADDDGAGNWSVLRDDRTVLATLRLDGADLVGEANSDVRSGVLASLVAEAIPGSELVADDVRSLADVAGKELGDDDADAGVFDPDDPAVRAALAEYMAEMEERWVDESVPALGGRTPREAAGDPVGREQLEHLLAEIPDVSEFPGGMGMSAARLRKLLGL